MKDIELFRGDCLDVINRIPNNSIDMVLTDPPYSSGGMFAGDRKTSTKLKYTDVRFNGASALPSFSGDNMDQRSFTEFMRQVFSRVRMKTKPEGVVAVFVDWRNLPSMTDAIQAAGWIWRGIVVWDKGTARNIPGRFRPDCEYIVWGTNGPKTVSWEMPGMALPGCYHIPSVPPKKRNHQTEKPLALLEALLRISPDNAEILDPFMGAGNTGIACINTGRKFRGIELNDEYFEISERRIEEADEKRKLAYTE